jgi:hypothetical protein
LAKHIFAKNITKQSINDESLTKYIVHAMKIKIQQTHNVIFIWGKRPNFNLKPNLKPFFYFELTLSNFDYG